MFALGIGRGFLFLLVMVCHTVLVGGAVLVLIVNDRIQRIRGRLLRKKQ